MKYHITKRLLPFLTALSLLFAMCPQTVYAAPAWPDNLAISAEGGIVMDADSGAVLYGKNIHTSYFPASITKILTALIVIENCDLDEIVTFSHNAVYNVESGSSSAGLDEGDQLTVRDCLYAMLLKSANEAANALAEHAAGSIEAFAAMMNAKASALGCTDSHFNNPSGLNDPEHYTSAYDMALIARAAFQNDTFVEIDSTLYYDIPPTKRNPEGIRVYPGHRMLKKNMSQYYPGIIGGKTGYTSLAGNTLVTCAERDDMKLITVVLNGHQTHYTDTKALLDFGFGSFRSLNAADYDTTYSSIDNDMTIAGLPTTDLSVLRVKEDCKVTLPLNAAFSDAVSSISYELPDNAPADAIALISYEYDGRQVGSTYLMRGQSHPAQPEALSETMPEAMSEAAVLPADADQALKESEEAPSGEIANLAGGIAAPLGNGAARTSSDDGSSASQDPGLPASAAGRSGASRNGTGASQNGTGASRNGTGGHQGILSAIPVSVRIGFAVVLLLAALIGGALLLKFHIEKKEEAERVARYQKRQQRLQDIGMSTADFDMLLQEKRTSALKTPKRKPKHLLKKRKSFLDSKKWK